MTFPSLFLSLLDLLDDLALAIILKAACRYLVQSQHWLVGILDEHIFALLTLETHVCDCAYDTPSVGERKVHLLGKIARLPSNNTEDDMSVIGLGVGTGYESIAN